ncbi:hypothetical protein LCGC14_1117420 [marine sediment metagenome]|uniref:Uncharacterized protein n=1 Tax=marine sediment metagenome TaxID=412755 RepID=A0A0F9M4W9_9ZZZZ
MCKEKPYYNEPIQHGDMETFAQGSKEHYQEYLLSREPFPNETPLTYAEFIESLFVD